ncbi:MAG TPA: CopD family protein, partial [Pseudonocardiaceae bacterium]|nr:CopD family protein [Pseudonocardiaceae bacterium]
HLLAMGGWLGGLVTLAVVMRPAAAASAELPAAVYRFSPIATGSVLLLISTGSYQSWRQLGSWAAFGSTDYGRLLLAKLVIVALLFGAAVMSRTWVARHRSTRWYRCRCGHAIVPRGTNTAAQRAA